VSGELVPQPTADRSRLNPVQQEQVLKVGPERSSQAKPDGPNLGNLTRTWPTQTAPSSHSMGAVCWPVLVPAVTGLTFMLTSRLIVKRWPRMWSMKGQPVQSLISWEMTSEPHRIC